MLQHGANPNRRLRTGTDIGQALARLQLFERLVKEIATPPLPERRLFATEWWIKPAPKTAGPATAAPHSLGGALSHRATCPHCGAPTNLMARIALSDPALPRTALGSGDLPIFWCLTCLEWDPAFFDLSKPAPQPLTPAGKRACSAPPNPGIIGQPT